MRHLSRRSRAAAIAALSAAALAVAGCSSGSSGSGSGQSSGANNGPMHVTLITKDPNDPFWVAMIKGATDQAKQLNVEITVASGKDQTDADSQIRAIEDATTRGDDAIQKAEKAGLFVIALDTPTTPANLVPATFASDNRLAGKLIGQWTAGALDSKPAKIALLDLFGDKVVSIDYERDQGFLDGMGINVADPNKNGDEAKSGSYSKGTYNIICNETTDGAEDGGRTAMEKCLSQDPAINVVYTANEPSALGAVQALRAAGNTTALVVSINGSCDGVKSVASGQLGADAQQYPSKMGAMGVQAIVDHAKDGSVPKPDPGLDFTNTGIQLVTDKQVTGADSISSTDGQKLCY
jgi:fructose transport system substrate-binding protein